MGYIKQPEPVGDYLTKVRTACQEMVLKASCANRTVAFLVLPKESKSGILCTAADLQVASECNEV